MTRMTRQAVEEVPAEREEKTTATIRHLTVAARIGVTSAGSGSSSLTSLSWLLGYRSQRRARAGNTTSSGRRKISEKTTGGNSHPFRPLTTERIDNTSLLQRFTDVPKVYEGTRGNGHRQSIKSIEKGIHKDFKNLIIERVCSIGESQSLFSLFIFLKKQQSLTLQHELKRITLKGTTSTLPLVSSNLTTFHVCCNIVLNEQARENHLLVLDKRPILQYSYRIFQCHVISLDVTI